MAKKVGKGGNPHFYQKKFDQQAYKLALIGLNDKQIADVIGVYEGTLNYWKKHKTGFKECLQRGKTQADANVAKALYQRAIGYQHPETHVMPNKIKEYGLDSVTGKRYIICERNEPLLVPLIKYYPPDSFACLKWLALRQRELWSETHTINHVHDGKVTVEHIQNQLSDIQEYSTDELKRALHLGIKEQIENGNVTSN